tara:strand:- start:269 stop:538 length:270 start_codon:yes stop_codon:yes gene_type:complete
MRVLLTITFISSFLINGNAQVKTKGDHCLKIESDSLSKQLLKIGDETAKHLSTRSEEEKRWFKKTFVRKRGGFYVPNEPIQYPFIDDDQ